MRANELCRLNGGGRKKNPRVRQSTKKTAMDGSAGFSPLAPNYTLTRVSRSFRPEAAADDVDFILSGF